MQYLDDNKVKTVQTQIEKQIIDFSMKKCHKIFNKEGLYFNFDNIDNILE